MKKKDKPVKLKIVERKKVCESRYGTVKKNNRLEPHEEDTVDCLTSYGFDLRNVEGDAAQTEKYIMKLFATTRGMRRLMIIKNNNGSENLLDIFK